MKSEMRVNMYIPVERLPKNIIHMNNNNITVDKPTHQSGHSLDHVFKYCLKLWKIL